MPINMALEQSPESKNRSRKAQGAMGRALSQIKDMIVNGELNPGEQIRQEEMALKLAVSRVPLREALNVLADQGLLYHRPHQGYFVTKRDPGQFAQIRRMLHLLENELMATIAWPGAADLQRLIDLNAQMQRCVDAADNQQLIELNQQFHFAIFGLSPNRLIMDEVARLWALIGQHIQGFAQGNTADGEFERHLFLPDLLAWVELATDNHVFDLSQRTAHRALGLAAAVLGFL